MLKHPEVLPFEEWKSRLLARGCQNAHNCQISAWEIDGDQEQWMFNEYTHFPHFGQVLAAALDPENHKAEITSNYMFGYLDPEGNPVYGMDPETCKETGLKPKEKFDGVRFEVLYYDYVMWVKNDFDRACELAYEMYRRRRLPTAREEE